jgi:hypothetical protein
LTLLAVLLSSVKDSNSGAKLTTAMAVGCKGPGGVDLPSITGLMKECEDNNLRVLVHCHSGINRWVVFCAFCLRNWIDRHFVVIRQSPYCDNAIPTTEDQHEGGRPGGTL